MPTVQRQEMNEATKLQVGQDGREVSPDLEGDIQQAQGGGQVLAPALQTQMAQAMGADFSGVRVHTDRQADQLNRSLNARAFTTGQDVFFKQGEYQPESRRGQELIAHELTHVVQQKKSQTHKTIQRVTNDAEEVQFHSLVKSMSTRDSEYLYLTHGTYISNLDSIMQSGLDPTKVGSEDVKGAKTHEKMRSRDAKELMKYAVDPNISLKYAMEPATKEGEIGVQLQIRVRIQDFLKFYDNTTGFGDQQSFWRDERGGENTSPYYREEFKEYAKRLEKGYPKNERDQTIWSVETNILVPPADIRVIGIALPPGKTYDESRLKTEYSTPESTLNT